MFHMQIEEIIGFHTYRIERPNMGIYSLIHQFSQLFSKFLQRQLKCEKSNKKMLFLVFRLRLVREAKLSPGNQSVMGEMFVGTVHRQHQKMYVRSGTASTDSQKRTGDWFLGKTVWLICPGDAVTRALRNTSEVTLDSLMEKNEQRCQMLEICWDIFRINPNKNTSVSNCLLNWLGTISRDGPTRLPGVPHPVPKGFSRCFG